MLKQFKNGLVQGLGFLLILGLGGATYAAWTLLPTESQNRTLTADKWNAVIDRLNSIDQKQLATAWVNFQGTSCTGGAGANECIIKNSYNINKIIRTGAGVYDVYFSRPMDNINYSLSVSVPANNNTAQGTFAFLTVNKFSVYSVLNDLGYDAAVHIQVFGGK